MEPGHVRVAQGGVGCEPLVRVEAQEGLDKVNGLRTGRVVENLGQRSSFHRGGLVQNRLSIVGANFLKESIFVSMQNSNFVKA